MRDMVAINSPDAYIPERRYYPQEGRIRRRRGTKPVYEDKGKRKTNNS
jgi:hypothetical protein